MPIDERTVGSYNRIVGLVGDSSDASKIQNVLALADGVNLASDYASLVQNVPLLQNSGGNVDRQRSALGTTGIPAINTEGTKATFSAGLIGFTPVATPTDIWTIIGSATKTVRVLRITISGTATAAASVDIQLIKRSAADTGSTPVTITTVPHDSNNAGLGTAVVKKFTVTDPTPGATLGNIRSQRINLGAAGAAGLIEWDFTTRNGQGIVLRGIAEVLCINWNGAAVPAGTNLCIDVEWSEE